MRSVELMCTTALAFLIALAIPVSLAAQAQPQKAPKPQYTVRDLGTLGGTFAVAGGISNSKWVEGYSLLPGDVDVHEFLWHEGVMTDLGTLGGSNSFSESRPNGRGDAGGLSETSLPDPYGVDFCGFGNPVICLALLWHNGVATAQPTLGGNNGAGFGTNDPGDLVGTAENTTPEPTCDGIDIYQVLQYKPVIWRGGRVHELPTFPGDPVGMAYAINDWGQVVGLSGPCGTGDLATVDHALLWQNGKVTDLGNLGGTMFHTPNDINNRGEVVGLSDLPGDTTFHAFRWQRGVMKDLGTLPGDVHSDGEGINCKGQVVGRSSDASFNGGAILWENGVMTDLNTLIPANSPLFLLNATSINDRGQIVGAALEIGTGEVHAFIATPNTGETDGDSATTAAGGQTTHRPNITLPEHLRKLLEGRGRGRLIMPR